MIIFLLAFLGAANIYEARVVRIIDGDTIRVEIAIWRDQILTTSIRVRGIDTPEIRGKCQSERELARRAKAFTSKTFPEGSTILLSKIRPDKYGGRYDAEVRTADGRGLADELIAAGLARAYHGAKRAGWCVTDDSGSS